VPAALPREGEWAEQKVHAELRLAPDRLRRVPLEGRLVTGDALSCQQVLCAQIRQAGGHSLFVIKANQPELLAEVALLFEQPPPGDCFTTASSHRSQHERHEVRPLTAAAALADSLTELGWAEARQVLRLERRVTHELRGARAGQTTQLVRYFLTSLGPHVPARRLFRLVRAHWHSENRLHYVTRRDAGRGCQSGPLRRRTAGPRRLTQRPAGPVAPTRLRQHRRRAAPFRLVLRRGALPTRLASYIMKRP
jgi:predicted transposase YbfD/YdcC